MSINDKQKDVNLVAQRLFKENDSECFPSLSLLSKEEDKRIKDMQTDILAMFSNKGTKPDERIRKATEFVDTLLGMILNHVLFMSGDIQSFLVTTANNLATLEEEDDTSKKCWKSFMTICDDLESNLLRNFKDPASVSYALLWIEDRVSRNFEQLQDEKELAEFLSATNMLQATITMLKSIVYSVRGSWFSFCGLEMEKKSCGLKSCAVSWTRINYSIKSAREVLRDGFFDYVWRLDILTKLRNSVPSELSVLIETLKEKTDKPQEQRLSVKQLNVALGRGKNYVSGMKQYGYPMDGDGRTTLSQALKWLKETGYNESKEWREANEWRLKKKSK